MQIKTIDEMKAAFEKADMQSAPKPDGTTRTVDIRVKDITGSEKVSKKGKQYTQVLLEYRNVSYDRLEEKKCALFDKEQASLILNLEVGKTYSIDQIKEKGFWVWKAASLKEEIAA